MIYAEHDNYGHARRVMQRARIPIPGGPIKRKSRTGIARQARSRTAQDRPLTERHHAILDQLDADTPIRPRDIADALDLTRDGVTASLYALQDRGLAARVPYKGWIRIPDQGAP